MSGAVETLITIAILAAVVVVMIRHVFGALVPAAGPLVVEAGRLLGRAVLMMANGVAAVLHDLLRALRRVLDGRGRRRQVRGVRSSRLSGR